MTVLFYFFKLLLLLSAAMTIYSKNPVHSVLFLVLVFCNASALCLMLDAEFLGLVLIVVYVGAIAVLFLFVCMMLNVRITGLYTINAYNPISGLVAVILSLQLSLLVYSNYCLHASSVDYVDYAKAVFSMQNIVSLGQVIYTVYFHYFILAAYVLLVGMLGAIQLTLHHRRDVRRQSIYDQVQRQYELSIKKTI